MQRRIKGEGSFRQRPDGRWEARIVVDGNRKSFYALSKIEAKKKVDTYLAECKKGIINKESGTLDEAILKWLREVKKNELKPLSYDRIESSINTHIIPSIGFYLISEIDEDILQTELINACIDKGLSYSSLKKIYDTTNAFFKWLLVRRKIPFNPMDGVSKVSSKNFEKKEICISTNEEIEKIKAEVPRTYTTQKSVYSNGYAFILVCEKESSWG
jgi:integrase